MREEYVPNLKVPGKKGPSHKMWLTALLCLALPPVGLVLLWGGARCPLRGKLWLTALSVAVMVTAMTLVLEWQNQAAYTVVPQPTGYNLAQPAATVQTTPVPAQNQAGEAVQSQAQTGEAEQQTAVMDGVIPSNPLG